VPTHAERFPRKPHRIFRIRVVPMKWDADAPMNLS
jgi:hypothetical protein